VDLLQVFRKRKEKKFLEDTQLKTKDNTISFCDEKGNEMYTTKETWLHNILLPDIKANYTNADKLYSLLISALNDKYEKDIIEAGKQLYSIDTDKERSACIYAIILMKNNQLDNAEYILKDAINKVGETGSLMTNLAKVYADMYKDELKMKSLIRGLEIDPNQDNGLDWYLSIIKEEMGEEGYINALKQVSQFKNAWRAYLLLAKKELEQSNINNALAYYKTAFDQVEKLSYNMAVQISGDLGTHGYINKIIELIEPHFDVKTHGIAVGNNLIKANIDLGYYDKARKILDELKLEYNPTWKKSLDFWDEKLYEISFKEQK